MGKKNRTGIIVTGEQGVDGMRQYSYNGPVMAFDKCIAEDWEGSTYAASEKKARGNLAYQFKKKYNKLPRTKITLPGRIVVSE